MGGTDVAGAIDLGCGEPDAHLHPGRGAGRNTAYTLTVGPGIHGDADNGAMQNAVTVAFTTAP